MCLNVYAGALFLFFKVQHAVEFRSLSPQLDSFRNEVQNISNIFLRSTIQFYPKNPNIRLRLPLLTPPLL